MSTNQPLDFPDAEGLFLAELSTIERAIRVVSHRGRLRDEEAEDFASFVKLKLIEDGYAVIRKYEGRSSFDAFIYVVVQRFLFDYRNRQWGKWHASAQARHLGEPAITLEAMLYRDGRKIEEILPALRRRWPELTKEMIEEMAKTLSPRTRRPRAVDLEQAANEIGAQAENVIDGAFANDRLELSRRIAAVVRATIDELSDEDRLPFRLHFESEMSVAEISRTLCVQQKPLYRRLKRALLMLRKSLEAAGIHEEGVRDVLRSSTTDLDFGFDGGTFLSRPSTSDEGEEEES